jgi:hypothetical protein
VPAYPFGTTLAMTGAEGAVKDWYERLRAKEEGAVGYVVAWLLGVPAGLLFLIFILRGCR